MQNDLYFIPVIAAALRQDEPIPAMEAAFQKIESLGDDPDLRTEYQQFLAFMAAARDAQQPETREVGDSPFESEVTRSDEIALTLENDGTVVAVYALEALRSAQFIPDILPGTWRLMTNTGCILWEQELAKQDLLLHIAFPEQPLAMAAATGRTRWKSTREDALLGGTLILRVYPGINSGAIEVVITRSEQGS